MNVVKEWQTRTELLIGTAALNKLKTCHILMVGLGGVGGICVEMLARAGIGEMTIVDGDFIEESNINRQIIATQHNLKEDKAIAVEKRLKSINPNIVLNVKNYYIKDNLIDQLFENNNFDYVVDCIDTLSPKVFLIKNAMDRNIPIVSSMGAGSRLDPTQIKVADISKTYNCRLAKYVRKRLNKMGIKKGITTVFSPEKDHPGIVKVLEDGLPKKSIVGTISYMPNVFGCFVSGEVIKGLLNEKK